MSNNIIYGAGVYGELFCNEMELNDIRIDFFIDQYTLKTAVAGKEVKRLKDVSLVNTNIFISITSPPVEVEVIKTLKELGATNIYSFIDTLHKLPSLVEQCVKYTKTWYSPIQENMIQESKFEEFNRLLKDDKSIKLLSSVKKFRQELTPETYLIPDLDPQYFPKDIDLFSHLNEIKFIDCGAFIGDTLSESITEFKRANKGIDYIVSFEPDKKNIAKLSAEVKLQKQKYPTINFFIFSCGVWSSNEILQFSDNGSSSSSIVNKVDKNITTIMTVSLDETLVGCTPNYIKMDIEGAEKEALLGAKGIIASSSPVLAISLYHKPQDIWELPLLINEINPNYDMYLRIYGSMGLELVLYCVPKNV